MSAWLRKHSCISFAMACGAMGVAVTAFAQDPTVPGVIATGDPLVDLALAVIEKYGVPGLIALFLGWQGSKRLSGIPVTHKLHDDDRALLRDVIREFKKNEQDQPQP